MYMDYKRLFLNWLQKEALHYQFFSNVITCNYIIHNYNSGKKVFKYIVKILNKDPRAYISTFVWEDTHQGYNFWLAKHFKWNRYLDKWESTH